MSEATGLYLYGFARPESLPGPESGGVDEDGLLFAQPHGDIAAVLSEVPLEEFTGPDAERHLTELAWLTPRVLRHEEAIYRVLGRSPVLPAAFGTIFTSRERVERLLEANHDTIAGFLDDTTGTEEWGIKLYLRRDDALLRLREDSRASEDAELANVSPGLRYMQERRLRAEADRALEAWLDEAMARLRDALDPLAVASAERRVFAAPETPGEMVANWAFLVATEDVERLREAAEEAAAPLAPYGLTLEWAGPFPPYSFAPVLDEPES